MIEEIFHKVENDAKLFVPKFTWSDDINEVADKINIPHKDDYPLRVGKTKELIEEYLKGDLNPKLGLGGLYRITEYSIKQMHSYLFRGYPYNEKNILIGEYRKVGVEVNKVGGYVFPEPLQIPYLMSKITPVEFGSNERKAFFANEEPDFIWWYQLFQTIHPFQDGNGRVGGIVVACLSYSMYHKYLTPIP